MSGLVDEVRAVITAESAKDTKGLAKYVEAKKHLGSMRDKGLIKEKGNSLLPIEERYKSAYTCK